MTEAIAALRSEVPSCKKCPLADHTFNLCRHPLENTDRKKGLQLARFGRPNRCPLNKMSVFVVAQDVLELEDL
jgi:hypothetical protein